VNPARHFFFFFLAKLDYFAQTRLPALRYAKSKGSLPPTRTENACTKKIETKYIKLQKNVEFPKYCVHSFAMVS